MKKLWILVVVLFLFGIFANSAGALDLDYTDERFGNEVVYNLEITSLGGLTYHNRFTVFVDGPGTVSEDWWATGFLFHYNLPIPTVDNFDDTGAPGARGGRCAGG